MLPEPVPPYTRLTLLLEKVLTFGIGSQRQCIVVVHQQGSAFSLDLLGQGPDRSRPSPRQS